jgi:hypothetical protein
VSRFAFGAVERGHGRVAGRYFRRGLDLEGFCWEWIAGMRDALDVFYREGLGRAAYARGREGGRAVLRWRGFWFWRASFDGGRRGRNGAGVTCHEQQKGFSFRTCCGEWGPVTFADFGSCVNGRRQGRRRRLWSA